MERLEIGACCAEWRQCWSATDRLARLLADLAVKPPVSEFGFVARTVNELCDLLEKDLDPFEVP